VLEKSKVDYRIFVSKMFKFFAKIIARKEIFTNFASQKSAL